jgi:adenylyltransferase/sulfurtransferase
MPVNDRYSRQILLKNISKNGQEKLAKSRATIIGCGALGTTIANNLVRSGIGKITVVDRDIIELNNLQRQVLFDEKDIGLPKASTLADKLKEINSEIKIDAVVDDVNHENIEEIINRTNVVLDGTDNMLIRFLINDACVKHNIPWIYGGAIKTNGMTMNIIPKKTPCLRCLINDLPKTGSLPTCDTVGVLNTIPNVIADIQSTEAIKILLKKDISKELITYDIWNNEFNKYKINRRKNCECCSKHNFDFLNSSEKEEIISLCESGFQITPVKDMSISFEELAEKLRNIGTIDVHPIVLRLKISNYEINVFKNGRAIIMGTNDKKIAKSLYAKYIGF